MPFSKQIRIISLGEIVTPDIMKTIQAFTALIASKKPNPNLAEIGQSIGAVMQKNMQLINDFKLGVVNEKKFTEQLINVLQETTGVEITPQEFDSAWGAMSPNFSKFEALLKQAVEYNSQPNQKVIFISFTNPIDIRNLTNELEKNKQSYTINDEQLTEINGIPLYTTYGAKKNKAELIEDVIKKSGTLSLSKSQLVNSMSNVVSFQQQKDDELPVIKYIRCVNNVNDPILKADLDQTNQAVENKAQNFFVDTILWMKSEQALSDALESQQTSRKIAVSKL